MREPVTSPGIRSGVNCTRFVSTSRLADRARTSSVFATPGTPSSRTWPRHNRPMTRPVTAASWPTAALEKARPGAQQADAAAGDGGVLAPGPLGAVVADGGEVWGGGGAAAAGRGGRAGGLRGGGGGGGVGAGGGHGHVRLTSLSRTS